MPEEIRMFVPLAIAALTEHLVARMQSTAQATVTPMVDLNPLIYQRIQSGDAFDIGLTNPCFVRSLVADRHIDATRHQTFGTVPLALARRAGDAGPKVVRGQAGIIALLQAARRIAYVGAGTSGRKYLGALDQLGVTTNVGPKSIAMERGTLVPALLSGQIDLMAAPLTTVIAHPALEPAAILPPTLGVQIELVAFVKPQPSSSALALLDLLASAHLDQELSEAGVLRRVS